MKVAEEGSRVKLLRSTYLYAKGREGVIVRKRMNRNACWSYTIKWDGGEAPTVIEYPIPNDVEDWFKVL